MILSNRTLWIGDNLPVLKKICSETVDLIYLDPPFNTNRIYDASQDSEAAGARFVDIWNMGSVEKEWAELKQNTNSPLVYAIIGAGRSAAETMQAYLIFMARRLQELYRILKPTGSLYLHCDPTTSHYLKQLCDIVFGYTKFQNEIIWAYGLGGSSPKRWSRKHDTLLFYSKTDVFTFSKPTQPATSQKMKGKQKGMTDVWNIPAINNMAKERTGWPTQKPIELLELVISASSNIGDMVLDPFSGSATTCVAAERSNRQWTGMDINEVSATITRKRLLEETDAAVLVRTLKD